MQKLDGQEIGRYHVIEELGHGGMATVYKAFDTRLEREVAIKLIRREAVTPENLDNMLKRFEREAKSLAKMTHPNIVKVHDFGEFESSPYLVMEFVGGGTLKTKIGNLWSWREAARVLTPIARALDYAHKSNIVHRDVKPANILITDTGEPMLSDFGIAKILASEDDNHLTQTGVGIGTPDYMAPEQWLGMVGPQTDIYSLGVVLYELVTGKKPFIADTPIAVLLKHANDPLPNPRHINPNLSEEAAKVLYKALAKKPEERYPDMGAFAAALERLSILPDAQAETKAEQGFITQTAQVVEIDSKLSNTPQAILVTAVSNQVNNPIAATNAVLETITHPVVVQPEPVSLPAPISTKKKPATRNIIVITGGVFAALVICAVAIFVGIRLFSVGSLALVEPTATSSSTPVPTHPIQPSITATSVVAAAPSSTSTTTAPGFKACMASNASAFNDRSYYSLAWEGFLLAEGKLDIAIEHMEPVSNADYMDVIDNLAGDDCEVIVTVGFNYQDTTLAAANNYPDIYFIGADQEYGDNQPANLVALNFHEDQAGYLMGALAGMVSKSGKVAALAGWDFVPAIWRYAEGFRTGAEAYGATAKVIYYPSELSDAFTDPSWYKQNTLSLIDEEGFDIFFPIAGNTAGEGVFQAIIQSQGIDNPNYGIGVDTDYYLLFPQYASITLSSALKSLDIGVYNLIEKVYIYGERPTGTYYGPISYASFHDLAGMVSADIIDELEHLQAGFNSGELQTGVAQSKP
jgi:serine/threonine protein kinase